MLNNRKFVALRQEPLAMRRHREACVAMRCHPEARFWPKDLNAKYQQDFVVEILRAENALRMTVGQRV